MNFDYPVRAKLTVLLLIVLILVSDLYHVLVNDVFRITNATDEAILYQKRFANMHQMLPRHGLVGYFSDKGDPFEDASASATKAYYLTQYTLAPLIVANTTRLPRVIGNFFDIHSDSELAKGDGLVLTIDFGNGLRLFSRPEGQTLDDRASKPATEFSK